MNRDGDGRLSKNIGGLVGYFLLMRRRCERMIKVVSDVEAEWVK